MKKILLIILVVLCTFSFITAEDQLVNDGIELFDSSYCFFIDVPDRAIQPDRAAE